MIGQLKYRAKLEHAERLDNGRGGWTEQIKDMGEIWVAQYRLTSRQENSFRQLELKADQKFIARYNDTITNHSRLTVNGKKYFVESVELPLDRNDFMEIYAVGEKNG